MQIHPKPPIAIEVYVIQPATVKNKTMLINPIPNDERADIPNDR